MQAERTQQLYEHQQHLKAKDMRTKRDHFPNRCRRTACMRLSPCATKCSAVVMVRSARMTASWTASELFSPHLVMDVTTCTQS